MEGWIDGSFFDFGLDIRYEKTTYIDLVFLQFGGKTYFFWRNGCRDYMMSIRGPR